MTYQVTVNGRPWKVALEAADQAGRIAAVVKGHARTFDVAWVDANTVSMIGVEEPCTVSEFAVRRREPGVYELVLGGRRFQAVVERQTSSARRGSREPRPVGGRCSVVAPMPGRVVRLLAAVGDRVKVGEGVIVVEAMKMENELRAPKDGIVCEVKVQGGAPVDAGAVLVVIE